MDSHSNFVLFGEQHWWTMATIVAISISLPLIVRKQRSEFLTQRLATFMATGLLILKAIEPFYLVSRGYGWQLSLPLHLCDIGAVAACIMLVNRNYFLYELTYFWGLGGTLQAILTPSLTIGFPHLDFWFFFISHGLIIVAAVYATVLYKLRPTLKSILRTMAATCVVAIIMAPVNILLDSNYLYLCEKPPTASLLNFLGPWPWYILTLLPLGFLFFFIYYSPFLIIDLVKRKKSRVKD